VQICTISRPRIFASALLAILGREFVQKRSKMLVEIFASGAGWGGGFVHTAFTNGGSTPD
jgi:hypothetical protein